MIRKIKKNETYKDENKKYKDENECKYIWQTVFEDEDGDVLDINKSDIYQIIDKVMFENLYEGV